MTTALNPPSERRCRSALFLPASNERAVAKAKTLAADVVLLDLEDAVAPERKADARSAARAAAGARDAFGTRELIVRVNAVGSPEFEADAAALRDLQVGVLLPKVQSAAALAEAREALGARPLWAMIESCRAMLDIAAIARDGVASGLTTFVVGANDLAREMGCRLDEGRQPIWGALGACVMAARANGLVVLDSVYNAIADTNGFAAECDEGSRFGFDGKTLIHPSQIEICNAAFSPSEADVEFARKIVAAFDDPANRDLAALSIEGRMVEHLHLAGARRTLARAAG